MASPPASMPEPDPAWHGVDATARDTERLGDPHPALRHLREVAPVNRTPLGFWRLSRHADCVRLLREVSCGVRHLDGHYPGRETGGEFMLQKDPPDHTRLRKLVSKAFTPRATERWRERAQVIADELLDAALGDPSGSFDLVAGLALPLPATLICEMLGVPDRDRERFTRWTADSTHALAGERGSDEQRARAEAGVLPLADYFRELIAERRQALGDDLLSVLIRAEEDGDRLSSDELLVQSIGLLVAGFETTIGLIGNGAAAFCRHPEQLERLRADPSLVPNAVEECLRFDPPVGVTMRVLHQDAAFGGRTIPKDTEVWAMLRSANRDPELFEQPDRFDVGRPDAREHLAFGGGTHLCLGAHLARMEAQVAFGTLARRVRRLSLVDDRIEWGRSLFRVPGRLPVRYVR